MFKDLESLLKDVILKFYCLNDQITLVNHCMFIISQLWLTFHPRSTVVLPDTGTPGASRALYSEELFSSMARALGL